MNLDPLAEEIAERLWQKMRPLMQNGGPDRWLDCKEAAAYLKRSEHSIRHLRTDGKLKATMLGGRLMFDRSDLDRAMEDSKE